MAWWREYPDFEPSRPRPARGGIKAHSRRGAFAASWWAKRWIAVLDSFDLGARLHRGRAYARRGQVLDVAIDRGRVEAEVQGSRPDPYHVTIKVRPLSPAQWERVAKAFARQARFAAKLLASEMPEDIESAFERSGLSLFPERRKDLETECSCPDWSNPCKHIAAVYYLLGEEFDRDPFLIFKLRGMAREDLVRMLGASRTTPPRAPSEKAAEQAEPLRAEVGAFWNGTELPQELFGEVQVPAVPAPLLRRLGKFPFWRGATSLLDAIEPVFARASSRGLDVFLGVGGGRK